MDIDKIRTLIELMEEKDLVTLEFSSKDESVSLTRYYPPSTPATIMTTGMMPAEQSYSHNPNQHQQQNQNSTLVDASTANLNDNRVEKSPMVGVFYSSPSPNDPPFAKVGQKVQAGDTLGIIEAMKIMNPLEATKSGIIDAILVDNAQVVEFGQPIIRYQS